MSMWNTKTLADMEETCRNHEDCACSKRINGKWLDITLYEAKGPVAEKFNYFYGRKQISRNEAAKLFEVK